MNNDGGWQAGVLMVGAALSESRQGALGDVETTNGRPCGDFSV